MNYYHEKQRADRLAARVQELEGQLAAAEQAIRDLVELEPLVEEDERAYEAQES